MTQLVGAQPYERTESRTTSRNGHRAREWDSRVGTVDLQIPRLRQGTYVPWLLEPRRRHERAPLSVVQQAYGHGISTLVVDHLAEAGNRAGRIAHEVHPASLPGGADDVLADLRVSAEHRRQIWSTNSLERLNLEVGRHGAVVGIFPNRQDRKMSGWLAGATQRRVHAQGHRTHKRGGGNRTDI